MAARNARCDAAHEVGLNWVLDAPHRIGDRYEHKNADRECTRFLGANVLDDWQRRHHQDELGSVIRALACQLFFSYRK